MIIATGYHMTFPFLPHLHNDTVKPSDADEQVLVTDGTQTHNLHLDIFYIPDPTLAFIGVPYHVATFSLFEYQAIAVAAVFGGKAALPAMHVMRTLYAQRVREKGVGKALHSLKESGAGDGEVRYVDRLVAWLNVGRSGEERISGHSQEWKAGKRKMLEDLMMKK